MAIADKRLKETVAPNCGAKIDGGNNDGNL